VKTIDRETTLYVVYEVGCIENKRRREYAGRGVLGVFETMCDCMAIAGIERFKVGIGRNSC
jgi:hypothetical protein